jgi:uncharacterized protein YjdB
MRLGAWTTAGVAGAALILGTACSKPTKVQVSPKEFVLHDPGGSKVVTATVLDQKDRPMAKAVVKFSSSAPEVAEVDAGGKVTAKGSGEAVITASCGKASASSEAHVRLVTSLKLALPDSGASGPAGSAVDLKVEAKNERGEAADLSDAVFKSSDPRVALVDKSGRMTLLTSGVTEVQASIGKASAKLTVPVRIEVPAAVKVETPTQTVALGETKPLEFTVLSDMGRPLAFPVALATSSDKIASVDEMGNVTGVARGTATITITAGTASNSVRVVVH